MRAQKLNPFFSLGLAATLVMIWAGVVPAREINWDAVPTKELTLFYPGESHWEWLHDEEGHEGASDLKKGESCRSCHDGEEAEMGENLVKAGALESMAIPGKSGVKNVRLQAAHDGKNIYIRMRWASKEAGKYHDFFRFNGTKWEKYGSHRVSSAVKSKGQPPNYEDRVAFLIDDGSNQDFTQTGCFLTCHTSMRHQPGDVPAKEVKAHAYLGKLKKRSDIRKYIPASRNQGTDWADVVSPNKLKSMQKSGKFLDLWQWRAHRSNPVGYADDDWVMEYRWSDKGKLFKNTKLKNGHPVHMFDKAKTGYNAFQFKDRNKVKYYYLTTDLAVPYDAKKYKPRTGDIIPKRLIQARPSGSRADVRANGVWKAGEWTLLLTRKLDTGDRMTDKAFVPGKRYTVGIAIHDDHVTTRFHHVSLEQVLGFDDPKADINVVKIK